MAEAEEVREKILIRDKIAIKEFGDLAFMSGIGGIICVLYDDLDEIICELCVKILLKENKVSYFEITVNLMRLEKTML